MSADIENVPDQKTAIDVEKLLSEQTKKPMLQVKSTPQIKLKDKMGRGGIQFNFMRDFGFIPEEIVIQKVQGRNNCIVVSAILPKPILEKEENDKKRKESKAMDKGSGKADKGSNS